MCERDIYLCSTFTHILGPAEDPVTKNRSLCISVAEMLYPLGLTHESHETPEDPLSSTSSYHSGQFREILSIVLVRRIPKSNILLAHFLSVTA